MESAMSTIQDILYVRFTVTDLDRQEKFLTDFGLKVTRDGNRLYGRGTDPERFIYIADLADEAKLQALGFAATSEQALLELASRDNKSVEASIYPGGGSMVCLEDPNGNRIEVLHGVESLPEIPVPQRSGFNSGATKQRIGERAMLPDSEVFIKRLGHVVLFVHDFHETFNWYHERFGILISDEIVSDNNGEPFTIGAFTRCNLGDTYVDHHTLFFVHAGRSEFNHAAFEVTDWDVLMKSHFDLQRAGYTHSHGIGKHLLGSQVFDYWKDPNGFTLEHFTDGDLFNESFGSHKRPPEDLLGNHWGPEGAPT